MTIGGVTSLVRAHNLIGLGILAAACAGWTQSQGWSTAKTVGFVAGCVLLAAGGYAFNDLKDTHLDRVAHPKRPLITGAVNPPEARALAGILGCAGIAALLFVDRTFLLVAPIVAALLYVYSIGLKDRFGLGGNLLTAFLVSLIPLLAGWCKHDLRAFLPIAALGFGLTFAREILKDLEDETADRRGGRRTLATDGHHRVATFLVAASVAVAVLPVLFLTPKFESALDFVLILVTCYLAGAANMWLLRRTSLGSFQRAVKIGMFAYVTTFLLHTVIR